MDCVTFRKKKHKILSALEMYSWCECEYLFRAISGDFATTKGSSRQCEISVDPLVASSNPRILNSTDARRFPISVLMRYSLGMPETSLSGRNTRIARNVRRSISRCMPCENAVMILPQKHTHPPHFTTYYSITLILTLLLNT